VSDAGSGPDAPTPALGVEAQVFARNLLMLPYLLRRAGVPVSTGQTLSWLDALTRVELGDRSQVYHASRALLTTSVEHFRIFDLFFAKLLAAPDVMAPGKKRRPRAQRRKAEPALLSYMADKLRPFEAETELEDRDRRGSYSAAERLQSRSFGAMSERELEQVKRLIQDFRWQAIYRKTRRFEVAARGQSLAMRRVLASAARHGGHALELPRLRRKEKQRPIVLLADISGSMERYARLVLHFFCALTHAYKNVEAFAFGTRLTRLTPALRLKNVDRAVAEASGQIHDLAGGTRIGQCLSSFNRRWAGRTLGRGAIVVILSDGWDRGDTALLTRELSFIARRCHRLIWLNPLLARQGYEPRAQGMAAALPYLDDFLPLDKLRDISDLAKHLAKLQPGRGSRVAFH